MKNIKNLIVFALVFILGACTNNFEETNANPNEPEVVSADLLLSTVISKTVNDVALFGWNKGNIVSQLTSKINFTDFDRYNWGSESGLWRDLYGNLSEVELILQMSRSKETQIQAMRALRWC